MQENPAYRPGPFSTTDLIDCSRNNAYNESPVISSENFYDVPRQIDPPGWRTVTETENVHEYRKRWCSCLVTILLVSMMVMVIAVSLSIGALVMQQQIRSDIETLQGLLKVSIQPSTQTATTSTPETLPTNTSKTSSASVISEPNTTTVDQNTKTTTSTEHVTAGTTASTMDPTTIASITTTIEPVTAGTTASTIDPTTIEPVTAGTTASTIDPTTIEPVTAGTTASTMDPTTIASITTNIASTTTTIESTTPSQTIEQTTTADISSPSFFLIGHFLNPASSCSDISQDRPPDYYWVRLPNGRPDTRVYCDPTPRECSNNVASMRVAYIDMRNSSHFCPNEFTTYNRGSAPFRLCGKLGTVSCVSTTFSTFGIEYSRVFGRVIGYQFDRPDAFRSYDVGNTIEDLYVGGVSLTHGEPPKHIWTFAGARDEVNSDGQRSSCPCIKSQSTFTYNLPAFIGQDYFCDTGSQSEVDSGTFYQADPLWDGEGCGGTSTCCDFNNPPWFCKELPQPTTDNVKLSLCADEDSANEGTPLEIVEIFVV